MDRMRNKGKVLVPLSSCVTRLTLRLYTYVQVRLASVSLLGCICRLGCFPFFDLYGTLFTRLKDIVGQIITTSVVSTPTAHYVDCLPLHDDDAH